MEIITLEFDWLEALGLFGAFLTAITFIPQVIKAWQTKSVGDLSLWMIMIVVTSGVVWLIYGIGNGLLPVIIANSAVLVMVLVLLYFKLTFKK